MCVSLCILIAFLWYDVKEMRGEQLRAKQLTQFRLFFSVFVFSASFNWLDTVVRHLASTAARFNRYSRTNKKDEKKVAHHFCSIISIYGFCLCHTHSQTHFTVAYLFHWEKYDYQQRLFMTVICSRSFAGLSCLTSRDIFKI